MNGVTLIALATALVLVAGPLALGLTGWLIARRDSTDTHPERAAPLDGKLILLSALMCTLAFNLTFFVQEFLLVLPKALTPGLRPTLFHNNHLWQGDNALAGLLQGTGALATCVSGLACALILARRRRSTSASLLLWWMAYCGLFMALPQVVVGAVSPQSDLGMALAYLQLGVGTKVVIALAALVAIPFAAFALRRLLFALADDNVEIASPRARTRFVLRTVTLPSLIALPLILLFRVPREWIEVVMVPVVVLVTGCAWIQAGAWIRTDAQPLRRPMVKAIAWPLGAVVVLLLIFQLILRPGIRFY